MRSVVTELFDTLLSHRNSMLSTDVDHSMLAAPVTMAFTMINGATAIPISLPEAW